MASNEKQVVAKVMLQHAIGLRDSGNLPQCCGCLFEGIRTFCTTNEEKVDYFAALSTVAPLVNFPAGIFEGIELPRSSSFWSDVISALATTDQWRAICYIMFSIDKRSPLEGIASEASTKNIEVSRLLQRQSDLDLKTWGIPLAIQILKKGSRVETIAIDEPIPFALVQTSMRTGCSDLLIYVMETSCKVRGEINDKDRYGNTALHVVTKAGMVHANDLEAILCLLLKYGASVNIRDSEGKTPIEYVKPKSAIHVKLSQAGAEAEKNIQKQIEVVRNKGKEAMEGNNLYDALRWYKNAISLAETVPSLNEELAKLHSNCSLVNYRLGLYKDALTAAHVCVTCDRTFYKGYWKMGQCYEALGDMKESLKIYIQGLNGAKMSEDVKLKFLVRIIEKFPDLDVRGIPFRAALLDIADTVNKHLPNIISELLASSSIKAIKLLILGETFTPLGNRYTDSFIQELSKLNSRLTFKLNLKGVDLSQFLLVPECDGMNDLIIVLLSRGADCESLKSSDDDTALHAAIKICAQSDSTSLLEYILQTRPQFLDDKEVKNGKGLSLYHTICEIYPSGDSTVGLQLTEMLLNFKFTPLILNNERKCASDLLPKDSELHTVLLRAENAFAESESESLKNQGNDAFGKRNYDKAIALYSQALNILESRTDTNSHLLAILHGNRAECYFKKKLFKESLEDGSKCVSHDSSWFRGHQKVAKSFMSMKRYEDAAKAYAESYNHLTPDAERQLVENTLTDMLNALSNLPTGVYSNILLRIGNVGDEVWMRLAYQNLMRNNFKAAKIATELISNSTRSLSSRTYDLHPLCNKDHRRHPWIAKFLLTLLKSGSDHRRLFMRQCDPYLLTGVVIACGSGYMDLLNWLIDNIAIPSKELNIQDYFGNTALHVACMMESNPDMKHDVAVVLIRKGVNPNILNNERQTALAYVDPKEKRTILKQAKQRKGSGRQHGFTSREGLETSNNFSQRKTVRGKSKLHKESHDCNECDELIQKATSIALRDIASAAEIFIKLLLIEQYPSRHHDVIKTCINNMIHFLAENDPTVLPAPLQRLKPSHMRTIIEGFAKKGRWQHLDNAIELYKIHLLPKAFGKYISVSLLIMSSEKSSLKLKLINLLQNHGADVTKEKKSKDALQSAFLKKEYDIVMQLIVLGVSPATITSHPDDTPLHAALNVALDVLEGDFSILSQLLTLHATDAKKYSYLHPNCVDQNGDTLLHVVCRRKYTTNTLKAIEILCKEHALADIDNKEGKRPIEYLPSRNDRRAQYLRLIGGSSHSTIKSQTRDEKKVIPHEDDDDQMQNLQSVKTISRNQNENEPHKKKTITVSKMKENIRNFILARQEKKSIFSDGYREVSNDAESLLINKDRDVKTEGTEANKEKMQSVFESELDKETEARDDLDSLSFNDLTWEVECTPEVLNFFLNECIPLQLKQSAIYKIYMLGNGEWKSIVSRAITSSVPIHLYETRLGRTGSIVWEKAVAFSARCSEEPKNRLSGEHDSTLVVKGGRVYSEIIRIWNITFGPESLSEVIETIGISHTKGRMCLLKKHLACHNRHLLGTTSTIVPRLFSETDVDDTITKQEIVDLYPPASPSKTEYHIIKFYSFSQALVNMILQKTEYHADFPFRVTDVEQALIQLKSDTPILLLGRSGTGKTTCCIYRIWTNFISYWLKERDIGEPFLLRKGTFIEPIEETNKVAVSQDDDTAHQTEMSQTALPSPLEQTCTSDQGNNTLSTDENVPDDLPEMEDAQLPSPDENAYLNVEGVGLEDVIVDEVENEQSTNKDTDIDNTDGKEEADTSQQEFDHLHQVFVTKNPVLCAEVKANFFAMCCPYVELQEHLNIETAEIPARLQDVDDRSYPLFMTSKHLLLMLDASLDPPYFFDRSEDGNLKVSVAGWESQHGRSQTSLHVLDSDDESDTDETADVIQGVEEEGATGSSSSAKKLDHRQEVTYDYFVEDVYPKLLKYTPTRYHPSLVWTEIMSFIKGSFEALSSGDLSKSEYEEIGRKRAPNFSGERDIVYELYCRYEHFKRQHSLFDEADIIQHIYKRLRGMPKRPWMIHQLFVDETQDFTQSELFVLLRIIQHPNDMFLTGDTAQGIMRGISFRFKDLKSLFHYAKKSLHATGQVKPINVPKKVHQLTHNYRSHAGILSLASAILDVMKQFFPASFDKLQPDQGLFKGPYPILLESCSPGDLAILLQGNKRKTSHIEFGAHQAILVVNDSVKNNMPEELSHGIVLTIYEAKGLEFDDVLLYNFFKDSQASKEWRIVTTFLENQVEEAIKQSHTENLVTIDEDVLNQKVRPRPLKFDETEHKLLNSELKHLYTAVTRARVNVWIFDENEEKRGPMFEFFKAKKLVKVISEDDMTDEALGVTMFAEKSTSEDWLKRAEEMMERRLYEVAAKCFRMGKDDAKSKLALALNQELTALRSTDNLKQVKVEFICAAEHLLDCSEDKRAVQCLQKAHEFELAGLLYEKCGMWLKAGKMYRACNKSLEESRCKEQLGHFNSAIDVLSRAELYEEAIDCLHRYTLLADDMVGRGQILSPTLQKHKPKSSFTTERLSYKAANCYLKMRNKEKMIASLERLPRVGDRIEFLKKTIYYEEAIMLMVKEGKTADAIRIFLQHGKVNEALDLAKTVDDWISIGECHYIRALQMMSEQDTDLQDDKIKVHLTEACSAFQLTGNLNYLGISILTNATFLFSKEGARTAFAKFQNTRPYANEAGMLESLDFVLKVSKADACIDFADIKALIRGVECMFSVLKSLLKPDTYEEKSRSKLYLEFYGLYEKDIDTVILFPKQKPRIMALAPELLNETEEQHVEVEKNKKQVCLILSNHLVFLLKNWINEIRDFLRTYIDCHLLCPWFMEGRKCNNGQQCRYHHSQYTINTGFKTLEALVWEVNLDSILQNWVRNRRELKEDKSNVMEIFTRMNIVIDENDFDSCERLLDFLIPEHEHMSVSNSSQLLRTGKVPQQIEYYFRNHWLCKGRQGENLLKERSKSIDWFVQATLFGGLFRVDLDIRAHYEDLEMKLWEYQPDWLFRKFGHHALYVQYDDETVVIESLGRRIHDVFLWLQEVPVKAVIEYSKCVRFLCSKDRSSLLPKMSVFCLWQELFACVTFLIIARLSPASPGFIVPDSYVAITSFFNCMFRSQNVRIEDLIQRSAMKKENIKVMKDCIYKIFEVICGEKLNLLKLLFNLGKGSYLQAERCFVIALVLMVNVDVFVSLKLRSVLMKTILSLSLPEDAPARLSIALEEVKSSKDTKAIAKALNTFLAAKGGHLLMCHWEQSGNEHIHSHALDIDTISSSQSLAKDTNTQITDETRHQEEMQNMEGGAVRDEDDGEEGDGDDVTLTFGEREERQCQQMLMRDTNIKDDAAIKIQRFFKRLTFVERVDSRKFKDRCFEQHLTEMFSPFRISQTDCGVCGVHLCAESGEKGEAVGSHAKVTMDSKSSDTHKTSQRHEETEEHVDRNTQFETFRSLHTEHFILTIRDIKMFISKGKLRDQQHVKEQYPYRELDISRLVRQLDEILKLNDSILHERKWNLILKLQQDMATMFGDFEKIKTEMEQVHDMKGNVNTDSTSGPNEEIPDAYSDNESDIEKEPFEKTAKRPDRHFQSQDSTKGARQTRKSQRLRYRKNQKKNTYEKPPRFQKKGKDNEELQQAETQFEQDRHNVYFC
ncbi:TPR and ankyrin repeat-containing protein 1-like [Haliotis cracherodii]|uniref:TPR and ankyrin repeat-containing protein 1-like n=1 Tax=Haliotis cracherodii TaxID=6455 RepID=UPI0039E8F034